MRSCFELKVLKPNFLVNESYSSVFGIMPAPAFPKSMTPVPAYLICSGLLSLIQNLQKLSRRHNLRALKFLDFQKIQIASHNVVRL